MMFVRTQLDALDPVEKVWSEDFAKIKELIEEDASAMVCVPSLSKVLVDHWDVDKDFPEKKILC